MESGAQGQIRAMEKMDLKITGADVQVFAYEHDQIFDLSETLAGHPVLHGIAYGAKRP